MKRKLLIIVILILSMFVLFTDDSNEVEAASVNYQTLLEKYYHDGLHTKKSNIYLNETSGFELSQYFHGEVAKDRTTYYNGYYLLMGDLDGGFDEINSGYRTQIYVGGSDMYHYSLVDGKAVDDYVVKNTSIDKFFVTLYKFSQKNYLDSTWVNGEHTVTSSNDKYLADFLAYTAPCLTDIVFDSYYLTDVGMRLTISEENHLVYGSYLALRIYATQIDSGKVGKDLLLSEARVYRGNMLFDESKDSDGLTDLKNALDTIDSSCIVYSNAYFNETAVRRIQNLYQTIFYNNQITHFAGDYMYRYSEDFVINEAYYNKDNNLYQTYLEGEDLSSKFNSSINSEDVELLASGKSIKDNFFTPDKLNSSYVETYGPATIKYTASYSVNYLGWQKVNENIYRCDRPEVIEHFLNICVPGFLNGGTYMTFRYVTIETNTADDSIVILRLYASPTQIGKLIDEHTNSKDYQNYLLLSETYIYDVDKINIDALENVIK